jgi:hypothetical protein
LQQIFEIININNQIQLTNFGSTFHQAPRNLDIYSNKKIREKFQNQKLSQNYKSLKKKEYQELDQYWQNYFYSPKSIKLANILFHSEDWEIIKPNNFLDYRYSVMIITDNPVYVEYIDWYCQLSFSGFEASYHVVHEKSFRKKQKITNSIRNYLIE